jgi:uncharacterized protein YjbI with pentapeptide repeats
MDKGRLSDIFEKHDIWLRTKGKNGSKAVLVRENFYDFDLKGCSLRKAIFSQADFMQADLSGADLSEADFEKARFRYAKLHKANLKNCNFEKANLINSDLSESTLTDSNLIKADLRHATLIKSVIKNVNLEGANLSFADLTDVDLSNSKIRNATLDKTILKNTNLSGVDLTGSKLLEVNLSGAILDGAVFSNAKVDSFTLQQLPEQIILKFGRSFIIFGTSDQLPSLTRTIVFPPKLHQAGISILNFFGRVLLKKYPDQKAKVKIEQNGLKVTLVVEPEIGEPEIFERALDEYGAVVTGRILPEEYTDDKALQIELRQELDMAQLKIRTYENLLGYRNDEIKNRDKNIDRFFSIIEKALDKRQKIIIKNSAKSKSKSTSISKSKLSYKKKLDRKSLEILINEILNKINSLDLSLVKKEMLLSEIKTIKDQAKASKPKNSVIRESLQSIRRILESAGGGITGQLLLRLGQLLVG